MDYNKPNPAVVFAGKEVLTLLSVILLTTFSTSGDFGSVEWMFISILGCIWLVSAYWRRIYYNSALHDFLLHHFKAYLIFLALTGLFYWLTPFVPNSTVFWLTIVGLPITGFLLSLVIYKLHKVENFGRPQKRVCIIGFPHNTHIVQRKLFQQKNIKVSGIINLDQFRPHADQTEKKLRAQLQDAEIDEIIFAPSSNPGEEAKQILNVADYFGLRIRYITLDKIHHPSALSFRNIKNYPLDNRIAAFYKENFDTLFALVILIVFLPLMLMIAMIIKLDSRGPVFYCPMRIGRGGKSFKLYKFRTMKENDPIADGKRSTEKNDPRITRVGKFLRKYSLDELPQFLNVLNGSMSVVGPRPHRKALNQELQCAVEKYMTRHYVKPGITGWAQVNGWRGPTSTLEQKEQRTKHDLLYMEKWSFGLDLKIIYLTVFGKQTHMGVF